MLKKLFLLLQVCAVNAVSISITIDDHPMPPANRFTLQERTNRILRACDKHDCKIAFFCVGDSIAERDGDNRLSQAINAKGHFLANHSYTHSFSSSLTLAQQEEEILKTEKLLQPFTHMRKWFRFPYLDYGHIEKRGGSPEKSREELALLQKLGYIDGFVTINTFDFHLDGQLQKALKNGDDIDYEQLKKVYVGLVQEWCHYYIDLYKNELGKDITHTLLLHANDINALFLDDIIQMIKDNGWHVVSPEASFKDVAWRKKEYEKHQPFGDFPKSLNYAAINARLADAHVFKMR